MEELIRAMLTELGEDPTRDGLVETPKRVSAAYRFLTSGYKKDIDEVINSTEQQQLDFFIEHRNYLKEDERDLMVEELTRVRNLADAYIQQLAEMELNDDVIDAEFAEVKALGDGS